MRVSNGVRAVRPKNTISIFPTVRFCATKESAHLVPFDLVIWIIRVVRIAFPIREVLSCLVDDESLSISA